jgi:hypothetical protein
LLGKRDAVPRGQRITLRRRSTGGSGPIAMGYDHHSVYGAEPMCRVPPIATSTHYVHASGAQILPRLSPRTERRSIETNV